MKYAFIIGLSGILCLGTSSCKAGYGCKGTEKYRAQTNRKGKLSTKKGKTNLFDKKTRKKLKN